MCRGVPGRVLACDDAVASIDFWGTTRTVRLELVDEPVAPGDYVLCQRGYAMRRIADEDVSAILALYEDAAAGD